jgi:hypothetical protein
MLNRCQEDRDQKFELSSRRERERERERSFIVKK